MQTIAIETHSLTKAADSLSSIAFALTSMLPTTGLTSLPDRPLTHVETGALDQHPSLQSCQSLFTLDDDRDTIVTIYLTTAEQTHLLVYNPQEGYWERITTFETPASGESPDLDVDVALDALDHYYGEEELTIVSDAVDTYEDLIAHLPPEPLSEEQFAALREREILLTVLPLTRRHRDDRVVLMVLLTIDITDRQAIALGVGYDPTDDSWHLVESLPKSALTEDTHDTLMSTLETWLENRYADEEIRPATDMKDMSSS